MNLTEVKPGTRTKIINITGGSSARLMLNRMNIRPDTIVEVISQQPWYGPITVNVGTSTQTIGRGLAQKIECELL